MPADNAESFRSIWLCPDDNSVVQVIDQRLLPHDFSVHSLRRWQDGVVAIKEMYVRGAPLIGATAAWSLYLASMESDDPAAEIDVAAAALLASRPTAVNLSWAVKRVLAAVAVAGSEVVAIDGI